MHYVYGFTSEKFYVQSHAVWDVSIGGFCKFFSSFIIMRPLLAPKWLYLAWYMYDSDVYLACDVDLVWLHVDKIAILYKLFPHDKRLAFKLGRATNRQLAQRSEYCTPVQVSCQSEAKCLVTWPKHYICTSKSGVHTTWRNTYMPWSLWFKTSPF